MITIRVTRVISKLPGFAREHGIDLPRKGDTLTLDAERSSGGFGSIHSVKDGARGSGPALVVKVPSEDCTWLGSAVEILHRALSARPAREWAHVLLAMPFLVVEAEIEGEIEEVTLMLDLLALGYRELRDGELSSPDYQRLPVHCHVEYADAFARATAFLESIAFLHGDLNEPNLLLHDELLDVQLVDLDSGAVVVNGDERARVQGKPLHPDTIPPEAIKPGADQSVDKSAWDLAAERWSIGYLLGYLIFGVPPSFFLRYSSAKSIDAYSRVGPWPDIDLDNPLFNPAAEAAYKYWRPFLEDAPGKVTETFVRFFRAGTNGALRPTAQDWVDALAPARRRPQFVSIGINPTVAPEGTEVVLTWEAKGAEYVEHPALGRLDPSGEATMVAGASGRQQLTAVNYYGRTEELTEPLRVVPLPRLTSIPLPSFPGLDLKARIVAGSVPRVLQPLQPPRLVRSIAVPPTPPTFRLGPQPMFPAPRFAQFTERPPIKRRARPIARKERSG
jgi:serine/threonine protein kinase